jgi:hypothetical protein
MPTACAAMPMRPASSTPIAIAKPWPSLPSTFSAGTRTSWNSISQVADARMPSFGSVLPRTTPGAFISTRNAVTPLGPFAGSDIANSSMKSATGPDVIQLFLPLIT